MKRKALGVWVALMTVGSVNAQMMVLEGVDSSTLTTGNLLDNTGSPGITTNVVEIAGLEISARSGETNQQINALVDSLGIDTDGPDDDSDRFEAGEKMILSFSRDIRINQFDLNHFDDGETFTVAVVGMPAIVIAYADLNNKSTDVFDTNLLVEAHTEMEFYTSGDGVVGIDGIDLTMIEPSSEGVPDLSILNSNGTAFVSVTFTAAAGTNYVLQCRDGLTDSNGWNTVSAPFSANTNCQIETIAGCGFFRAISQ